jgi:AcrR family transcriptional regulator
MRERFRAQVRDDVKRLALRQLADAGPEGLSINAIAKQLGVSGPALYRYFDGREALLTELIVDAYDDLADVLEQAVDAATDDRLRALARAYRAWALAQPHRYRLLFGPPLPGYDAHAARLVEAAGRSMTTLLAVLGDGEDVELRAIAIWARLHGLVGLELGGNFDSMGVDSDELFERELTALA